MPIYEYQCDSCGHRLEVIQKTSDTPLRECPECGTPTLRKLISPTGFRLKGGGWYETDFKSGSKRNVAGSDNSKPASSSSSGSGAGSAKAKGGAAKATGGAAKATD